MDFNFWRYSWTLRIFATNQTSDKCSVTVLIDCILTYIIGFWLRIRLNFT